MIFWLTLSFFFSQVFAGLAIIADIFSFQFKERQKIIIFFMIAASCIALHYLFLERYVAALLIAVGILRFFVAYHRTDTILIYLFTVIYTCITYVFYKDIFDIIVYIATILITIWVFQSNDRYLRLYMMCGTSFVILYNFLIFSPVWVLLESIFLSSNLIGYYRHYLKK